MSPSKTCKSLLDSSVTTLCRDFHPSIRTCPSYRKNRGSSPRVRVQPNAGIYLSTYTRIIPACAGTTNLALDNTSSSRDHPRVCGYNSKKSHNFSDSQFYRSSFPFSLISFSLYIILTNLSFCL